MSESSTTPEGNIFLLITRDKDILNPSLPAGKFVADISASISQLHIVYLGNQKSSVTQVNDHTWLYTVRNIPLLSFFAIHRVIHSQLVWKRHFLPTIIVSMGDEIRLAKRYAKRHRRPLYVFYSYMKVLGRNGITTSALLGATPTKIFIPNEYIGKAIENHPQYKKEKTEIKILTEYIDISQLEKVLESERLDEEIRERNKIFNMVVFPRRIQVRTFSILKGITTELMTSIAKFNFTVVVPRNKFFQARVLRSLFGLKIILLKERQDSTNLFLRSRLMLYFDSATSPYEPILYSFIAGCPVLSSGDEYSKIILFKSGFEEYGTLLRDGSVFGMTIKKLINDPYLYTKYKMNCTGFTKTAFTQDHDSYRAELKTLLNDTK